MGSATEKPRIHVIGNGDSNKFFNYKGEYRVACNIPQHGISYNALSIIDVQPVQWMRENNWHPKVPVLCNKRVKEMATKLNREGHWFETYASRHRWNSLHHAVDHHAPMTRSLHIWGADSIWTGDYTSQMDNLVPRNSRPNLNLQWIPNWKTIFETHTGCDFYIHGEGHNELPWELDNVYYVSHIHNEIEAVSV